MEHKLQGEQLQKLIDTYVIDYSAENNFTEKTMKGKKETLARVVKFLEGKPLNENTARAYIADLRSKNWKPSSIKCETKTLKAFSNFLVNRYDSTDNWGKKLITPKVNTEHEPLVSAEVAERIIFAGTEPERYDNKMHRRQKEEMRLAMRFALRTGLRACELLALKGSDLFLFDPNPWFRVHSKGGSIDRQPFPLDMINELKSRTKNGKLFSICPSTCNKNLKVGAQKENIANVKMHLHILRKIFGTSLARNGVSMSQVSRLMRHKSMEITQKFYITYGLDELSDVMNTAHPLIRQKLPQEQVINLWIQDLRHHVANDNRFEIEEIQKREQKERVIRIRY